MPLRSADSSQIAGSHLSRPIGESSKIVPTSRGELPLAILAEPQILFPLLCGFEPGLRERDLTRRSIAPYISGPVSHSRAGNAVRPADRDEKS